MADLDVLMGGTAQPTAEEKAAADAAAGMPQKPDKNKPVPWKPRTKAAGTLQDAKKAVENEQWDKAFLIMADINKDPNAAADPIAKQISNLLAQKMGIAPQPAK